MRFKTVLFFIGLFFSLNVLATEFDKYSEPEAKCFNFIFAALMSIDNQDFAQAKIYASTAKKISDSITSYKIKGYAYAVAGLVFQKRFPDAFDIPGRQSNLDTAIQLLNHDTNEKTSDTYFLKILKQVLPQNSQAISIEDFKKLYYFIISEEPSIDSEFKLFFFRNLSTNIEKIFNSLNDYTYFLGSSLLLRARHHANLGLAGMQLTDNKNHKLISEYNLYAALKEYRLKKSDSLDHNIPFQSPEIYVLENINSTVNYNSQYYTSKSRNISSNLEGNVLLGESGTYTGTLYSAIEIGAAGVKFSVISESSAEDGDFRFDYLKYTDKDTKFSNFSQSSFTDTYQAVTNFYQSATKGFNIPTSQIFIVFSSGCMERAITTGNNTFISRLSDTLSKNLKISFNNRIGQLTVKEEARLTLLGIIPFSIRDKIYSASIVDIGTGNVKGGFCGGKEAKNCSEDNFKAFNSKWGLKNIMESITAYPDLSSSAKAQLYGDEARRFIRNTVMPELNNELDNGILAKQEFFLTGGIFWAIATLMHPEKVVTEDKVYVGLSLKDIQDFEKLAINSYPTNPTSYTEKINAQIRDITSNGKFPQAKAIVGSILAEEIIKALQKSSTPKVYYYAKYSLVGWPTGYIIREISDNE